MTIGMVVRKAGMTQVFTPEGEAIPVTVLEWDTNFVTQVKTPDVDKYSAIQITTGTKRASRVNAPKTGHFKKANVAAGRILKEFRVEATSEFAKAGAEVNADIFSVGDLVDVTGTTKGKGFQGVIKRHGFSTQDATHGNSLAHRAPGSIGQCQTPGRVWKGKKMAGQMGNKQRTVQSQEIVRVDMDKKVILVKGCVPGHNGADIIIKPAVKSANKPKEEVK